MSTSVAIFVGILIGLVLGGGGAFALIQTIGKNKLSRARAEADQLRENARSQAENKAKEIELAAKQEQLKLKEKFERENESARKKLDEHESRLAKREDTLDRKLDTLTVKERNLDDHEHKMAKREKDVAAKEAELTDVLRQQRERLLNITNLTPEQAREMLLGRIENECKQEAGALIQKITEQAQ